MLVAYTCLALCSVVFAAAGCWIPALLCFAVAGGMAVACAAELHKQPRRRASDRQRRRPA